MLFLTFQGGGIAFCSDETLVSQEDILHQALKCPYWTHVFFGAVVGYVFYFSQVRGQTELFFKVLLEPFISINNPLWIPVMVFLDFLMFVGLSTIAIPVMLEPPSPHAAIMMGTTGTFFLRHSTRHYTRKNGN